LRLDDLVGVDCCVVVNGYLDSRQRRRRRRCRASRERQSRARPESQGEKPRASSRRTFTTNCRDVVLRPAEPRLSSRGAAIVQGRVQHRCSVSNAWWFSGRLLSPTQERAGEGRAVFLSKISASARATGQPSESLRRSGRGRRHKSASMNLDETKVSSAAGLLTGLPGLLIPRRRS